MPDVEVQTTKIDGTLDKVLAIAKEYTDREITSVDRSFDRFTSLCKWLGGIALAIFAFLGLGTYAGLNSKVQDVVDARLPAVVQVEVQKKFAQDNVQATVRDILTKEARSDIESMVEARVGAAVDAAIAKQQGSIRALTEAQTREAVAKLEPQISAIVTEDVKRLVAKQLQPRHLSPEQVKTISDESMRVNASRFIVRVRPLFQTPEQINFATEIHKALEGALWKGSLDVSQNPTPTALTPGIFIEVKDPKSPPPGTFELKRVLERANLTVNIVQGSEGLWADANGTKSVPLLVIGTQFDWQ